DARRCGGGSITAIRVALFQPQRPGAGTTVRSWRGEQPTPRRHARQGGGGTMKRAARGGSVDAFAEAVIGTERLLLTPLGVQDADELVGVLDDPRLHRFIGGRPASLAELRARYARLTAGSPRPGELWRNWVVRRRADLRPVGTVQATLTRRRAGWTAHVAWV